MNRISGSSAPRKILVLASTFPRWKGDHEPPFVLGLSSRLAEDCDVTVLAPHAAGAKSIEKFGKIRVHRFHYCFSRWEKLAYDGGILANLKKSRINYALVPFFMLAQFIYLLRLMKTKQFDVIHAHWLIPQGLIAIAARMLLDSKPVIVCTSHGGDLFGLPGIFFKWVKRQVIQRADKVTVVSHAMRDYAITLTGRKDIDVIPMGVELQRRFTPAADLVRSSHEILFVGRLVEKKGVAYLIQAMQSVLQSHPDASLLIVGDGPDKPQLQKLSAEVGMTGHVRFMGKLENDSLQHLYRRAAVFVAPSVVAEGGDQEGLGLVFVEAMGCECAVVGTDLPAIRDVVIDGVTGLICKQKDSADLARKILHLLDDPVGRMELGRAGRMHAIANFEWDFIASRYRALMDQLPSGKQ